MTRHVPHLASALVAVALVACAPPSAAGTSPAASTAPSATPTAGPVAAASPAATASPAAAASPGASPAASMSPLKDVVDGPNMIAYSGAIKGYLALPPGLAAGAKAPGVVMVHENRGLNPFIQSEAERLAKEGYVVLAANLLGPKYAETQDQARALTTGLDQAAATANLQDAVKFLRARADVGKVGALGWCFGGGQTMKLLLAQKDLSAGVIYYGALETDSAKLAGLPPVLGNFGQTDMNPAPATVDAFSKALDDAKVTKEIYLYEGAGHAFANPSGGERYKKDAADLAWTRTLAFLGKHLK